MLYLARKKQQLHEHLSNTANLAKEFAGVFGCANTAYITGLLHDLGKYTAAFQDYLTRSLKGEKVTKGEVIHSLQGAKYITESLKDSVIVDIIGNIIASHHGGLFDNITDGDRTLYIKTHKNDASINYEEAKKIFSPSINESEILSETRNICQISRTNNLNIHFMLHLLTKVLYSCLVDADRCDAAGLTPGNLKPDWAILIQHLENYLEGLPNKTVIDDIRSRISIQCKDMGSREPGVYTLSVPTGGGKTLSSLRFALEHAMLNGMKRIIYIIPYLSIIDQTSAKIREIFMDDELILEHHSNMELSNEEEDLHYQLLTSRWDSTIIVTTMVQFLETIYSNKASKLRKFHNMSEAVLIFDEVQSLPIKCIHLFNEAVNFLHTFGKSTVLLCTATQPDFNHTEKPILLSANPDIISITSEEMEVFERVHIKDETQSEMSYEDIAKLVKTQIEAGKSTLVILNTKIDAKKVFEQCKKIECEKAFLTTDLCPAHRLQVIERLRSNLAPETKRLTICISTQLIEAGVDLSFDCVIRAKAGLDSIIQAAGRCNRNKEKETTQPVYVINVKDEDLSRLQEIKEGQNVTTRVFREYQNADLLSRETVAMFYKYYFFDQKRNMDFKIERMKTTIYNLLSDNLLGAIAYRDQNSETYSGLPCAFKTAAELFSVIDGGQTGIVVPYGDSLKLVADFQNCLDPRNKFRILKQLQKYTVSVYSNTLLKIEKAVKTVDNTFYLLDPAYYDTEELGLLLEPKWSLLYV